ncbi:hypothetical protein FPRO03_03448 [Fusarium proliferatum]|nr:hypothetical protein FPRO03_03448 [Fusarium proliferatum]
MNMNYVKFLSLFYLTTCGAALGNILEFCTEEPALSVEAGSDLSMKLQNSFGAECSAELEFSDGTPSMKWYFKAVECADAQLARFSVPFGVPNGDAYITWQCDGDNPMSCNRIVISKGRGDLVLPTTPRLITETARCISPTTFLTHVVTHDKEKPTGVFLDTGFLKPIISGVPSTPASKNLDLETTTSVQVTVSTPATPRLPRTKPSNYKPLIGTGETRARLSTDTSTPTTPINTPIITSTTTNTASITVPVLIPIGDPTTTSFNTNEHTRKEQPTNKPSYVTVTSIISTCPMPMPVSTKQQG